LNEIVVLINYFTHLNMHHEGGKNVDEGLEERVWEG
jgi:hypothetical protein